MDPRMKIEALFSIAYISRVSNYRPCLETLRQHFALRRWGLSMARAVFPGTGEDSTTVEAHRVPCLKGRPGRVRNLSPSDSPSWQSLVSGCASADGKTDRALAEHLLERHSWASSPNAPWL